MVDDISCFKSAKKTQEEFLILLDEFHAKNKLVVVTSMCEPSEIAGIDQILASRLSAGLSVRMDLPDTQFKQALLESFLCKSNVRVEPEALYRLATEALDGRTLKGVSHKIAFLFSDRTDVVTTDEISKFFTLKDDRFRQPEDILNFVSTQFNVDRKLLLSKTRRQDVCKARNQAMYLMREKLKLPFAEIGRVIGHRDPSTVQIALKKLGIQNCKTPDSRISVKH
ncbi:MAG: helix-turn-helix domain-containing protein [Bdellovibrionia bacterium]